MPIRSASRALRAKMATGLLVLVASCAVPIDERGWVPTGANEANLRLMIAEPQDLERGRGSDAADGAVDARAVDRWRRGEVVLPETSSSGSGMGVGNGAP